MSESLIERLADISIKIFAIGTVNGIKKLEDLSAELNSLSADIDKRDWQTGKPTEDGDYFVAYHWGLDNKIMHDMASRILYGATTFENGNWKIDYPYSVVAWQKIEPYKETNK